MIFLVDGNTTTISEGALYSLLAIVMVFVILLIIIGITTLVFKALGLFEMKAEIDAYKKGQKGTGEAAPAAAPAASGPKSVEIKDDDMMAAVLVATIDYRKETGKDVRLVSVKEIK